MLFDVRTDWPMSIFGPRGDQGPSGVTLPAPAIGRHDARESVRSAAVAGKLSHRTDRAARRGLRGRGQLG